MTKSIFLFLLFALLLIAGCNQKNLTAEIDGTWHVQEYAVNGQNLTSSFDSTHADFSWTFANGNQFSQSYQSIKVYSLYTLDTITHYDTTTHAFVIDSVTTTVAKVPTSFTVNIQGDWYLTNGNEFLETRDSLNGNYQYQILAHSKNSLHLLYGNVDYYLSK
jgi:hypothetical protein